MAANTNMSYMLQFPPSELPRDILSPPYVLFGINGVDTFSKLRSNIPLALVLHFAPDLNKWILPPPELSFSAARLAARVPFVTIDIKADIEVEGLSYILARMMQTANMKMPPGDSSTFMINPNLLTSVSIYKAWLALGLSPYGINGLYLHIQSTLILGGPVYVAEMKAMWHTFPVTAPLLELMGRNYAQSYMARSYTPQERSAIRHWYLETTERWTFFRRFEKMYPAWDDVQEETVKAVSMRHASELYAQRMHHTTKQARADKVQIDADSKRSSERMRRAPVQMQDRNVSSGSASTMNSISSSGTAIWDPVSSRSQSESSATSDSDSGKSSRSLSKPVDSSKLIATLKNMAVQSQLRDKSSKASKMVKTELTPKRGEVKKAVGTPDAPTKGITTKESGLDAGEALGAKTCAPSKSLGSAKSEGTSPNASKSLSANTYVLQPSVKSQVTTLNAREVLGATTYIPSRSTKIEKPRSASAETVNLLSAATYVPSKSTTTLKPRHVSLDTESLLSTATYVQPKSTETEKPRPSSLNPGDLLSAVAYVPPKSTKTAKPQESSLNTGGLLSTAAYVPPKPTKTTKLRERSPDTGDLLSAATYNANKPASSTSSSENSKQHSTINSKATRELVTKALATAAEILTHKSLKAPEVQVQAFAKVDADGIRSIDFAAVHAARDHTPVWKGPACLVTERRVAKMAELREIERKAAESQAYEQEEVVMETTRGDEAEQ